MPNAAHDAWLKSTLGIDAAGPSTTGTLPPPAAGKQAQDFHSQFQAALTPIDEALAYIGGNAEAAKSSPVADKRGGLAAAYQAAAAQIDPADENKAKSALANAIGQVQAVASQAAAAKAAAQKALEDWKAQEPKGEAADSQLAEMEEWKHPKAPPLRGPLDAVMNQATAKQYTEACSALAAVLPTIQPVWDDYQKQKAAQAEYEPASKELEPRLTKAATSQFKKLEPMQQELQPAQADMAKDAEAKNYVDALAKQKALAGKTDAYEKALAELQAKKQEFDDAKAEVQPKLDAAKQVVHPKLAAMQQDLATGQTTMDQAAQAEDFDKGLATAKDISTKADTFDAAVKELEQKKKDYEDALATLQPRLDTAAQCAFKTLAPLKDELPKLVAPMQAKATAEDYDGALKDVGDLSTKVDAFETEVKAVEEKKKAYEDARKNLDPKLAEMAKAAPHKKLEADKKAIDDAVPIMEKAAGDEDYAAAQTSAADLGTKADKYAADAKEIDDKKQQYDDAMAKIQPRLDEMKQTRIDELAPMQQEILKRVDDIKKSADEEDFDTALKSTETLSTELDKYAAADASKIYKITWDGKDYYGNEKELAALKLKLVQDGLKQVVPTLKNRAEACEGRYTSLKELNDQQYIVAFFVQGIGGANLGTVASAISAHKAALSSLQAATSDADAAKSAYAAAVTAVNATGQAITTYMDKLESGAATTITALQVVEVTAFAIAAACGGAILLPEGAGILAGMAANGISATGFGAMEAAAQQYAPAIVDGKDVDWSKAKVEIGKAALLNGVGGLLGGAMGGKLKEEVGEQIIKKLAIDNPEVKKRLLGALEGAMGNLVQAAIANRPDLASGKMTTGEFVSILVQNAIAGGLGGAITPGMKKF